MNDKREAFLARLRETFRVEADEHLTAITSGLLAIERADDARRAAIVEEIFREAHSLKGAARAVTFPEVEELCLELEGVFAALKRKELPLSAALLDLLHPLLDLLTVWCARGGVESSPVEREKRQNALAGLSGYLRGVKATETLSNQARSGHPVVPPGMGGSLEPPSLLPCTPEPNSSEKKAHSVPRSGTAETVRVSTRKLAAVLSSVEELVGAKLAANGHAVELRRLVAELWHWNLGRVRLASRCGVGRAGDSSAGGDLLESEMLFARSLENALRSQARIAQENARVLETLTDTLLDDTKKTLMLPCSSVLGALAKVVHDLGREQDKDVELVIHGEDIEIDRRVLDELKDPLLHLLRNAVDHGIEKPDRRRERGKPLRGKIEITVVPVQANSVEIRVADDGSGIDVRQVRNTAVRLGFLGAGEADRLTEAEQIALIFQSGLSTSPLLTDLSGRGLGLAIVREKVEKLGGTIAVASNPGLGATFRMFVPLTLASFRGVFVKSAGLRYVIPTANVTRVFRVRSGEIRTVENRQAISHAGRVVSLVRLRDVLGLSGPEGNDGAMFPAVLVRAGEGQVAFLVDEVQGEQEVMVKGLGPHLSHVRNVAGIAVSGSGNLAPILHAHELVESSRSSGQPFLGDPNAPVERERRRRVLVAEDSITARTLVKTILEGAGYEVGTAVDGLDALTTLKTDSFDLVVSDVDMPRLNGFELTSRIRADKTLEALPVVLVTALGSQKDREYGIEVGANAYIIKSDFDQGNLLEIIRRLL